jgi:hypothetical protein
VSFQLIREFRTIWIVWACQCNLAFNMGNQSSAVTWMNKLFEACYAGNGHKLLQIESKATQPIGFAFANIALYLDFDDEDMNSVAAENAIYCLGRSMIESNNSFCAPPLFKILQKRRNLGPMHKSPWQNCPMPNQISCCNGTR